MKKVGKTTRPFRYDLNQIPYDYTVEVRNRFKGLDHYGRRFMTLYGRQGSIPSSRKRKAKRQNGYLRRHKNSLKKKIDERQRRKGKIYSFA